MSNPGVPSVGRMVHFHDDEVSDQPMAAIITYVREHASVDLTVFVPLGSGSGYIQNVPYEREPGTSGTWSWPPRV